MKKAIFIFASIAMLMLVAYETIRTDAVSGAENDTTPSVKTTSVSSAPYQETAEFSGFVQGINQVDVNSIATGYIVQLMKEEGDIVRQGEVLAVLDGRELTTAQKNSLLELESFDKTLKTTGAYYDQKVDEAKVVRDVATGVDDRASAEEALKSAKRLRDTEMSSLKTERARLRGFVLATEVNASRTVIRAPFSGTIMEKNASIGTLVYPGVSVYALSSLDALEVVVSLPRASATRITKHSKVTLSNGLTTIEGQVFSLALGGDGSSQQSKARVRFPVVNSSQSFSFGEHVRVSFEIGLPRMALFIPEQAILARYDTTSVYVVEENLTKKIPVSLGVASGNKREIVSELPEGAHIVVEGAYGITENQSVRETYVSE